MRRISRFSNAILRLEKRLISALAAALVLLILLNIVTRSLGAAIFWVDELAIYAMVWMALVGASVMVRQRLGIAVTLATDRLPPRPQRIVARLVDAIVAAFAVSLLLLSWQWYDPIGLARSGFDFERFAQETFKFIYTEPTSTLGIRKFWIWLAVPLMATAMTVHAIANLLEGPPAADAGAEPGVRPIREV